VGGPRPITVLLLLISTRTQEGNPLIDPVNPWFNTLAFRQAVAYSINRQSIINNIYRGLGVPINSPIIPKAYYLSLSRV